MDMYYVYDYMCIYILYTYYRCVSIHQAGLGIDLQWVPEVPIPPVSPFGHDIAIFPYDVAQNSMLGLHTMVVSQPRQPPNK